MEDLITVVVPVYNRSNFLSDTIESILGQTYTNLEIFLIDDGSTDNSLDIMKRYEKLDKRIKVFTQKNKGTSMTFEKATLLSNGKYIVRNDSDDISELNRFEEQLKFLKEGNFDMVGCYIRGFGNGNNGKKIFLEKCVNKSMRNSFEQKMRIIGGQTITGGTIFAKSDVLKELLPFDERYSLVEDWYLSVMLFKNNKRISILEKQLLNYRVHNENMSLNNLKRLGELHTEVQLKYLLKDIIDEKKRIIFFRREDEIKGLEEILIDNFGKERQKFEIVSLNKAEDFLESNREVLKLNEENLVFFGWGGVA